MEMVFLFLTAAANLAVSLLKLVATISKARKEKGSRSGKRKPQ